jgi:hypothetical protein
VWLATVLALSALVAWWMPPAAPQRFELLAGGAEVKDLHTGLVWRRCAEGQRWSGAHCTGQPLQMPQLLATAHAASQPGWRLPSLTELHSLVDPARQNPALDPLAFPDTPGQWFWTSTLASSRITHAWTVHFGQGKANYALRMNHLCMRLVRADTTPPAIPAPTEPPAPE